MIKILISISILTCAVVLADQNAPETTIKQGTLRGKYRQTWKGRKFSAFTGIPYAKPPVGDLRFMAAIEAEPWKETLDASKSHAICPQGDVFFKDSSIKGDEDCLYLNVYSPLLSNFHKKRLPVMFFIHGGGWTYGSANPALYGPDILLDKDVILVTANYRLGALGFLSTGDEVVPGNNGLKDQTLALRWVKENIRSFGGDPNKVTVFGQSAGAASTHYLILSPLSIGLINRAIAHSGSALVTLGLSPNDQTVRNTQILAQFLNCPTDSSEKMVECLKKVYSYDIIEQDKKFLEWAYEPIIPFKPVIEPNLEGSFLTKHPIDIIKSGETAGIPFMTGFTTEDGGAKAAALYDNVNFIKELDKDFNTLVPLIIQYQETASSKKRISKTIRKYYFGNDKIDDLTKPQLTNMITDGWFHYPQNLVARLHTKYTQERVYYYVFGYRGSIRSSSLYGDPSHDYGVCHGDDLNYLFSSELFPNYKPTESDQQMIDVLTTLWTNFAATGDPTPEIKPPINTKWQPVQSDKAMSYYFIESAENISMVENLYKERAEFWDNFNVIQETYKIKDEL